MPREECIRLEHVLVRACHRPWWIALVLCILHTFHARAGAQDAAASVEGAEETAAAAPNPDVSPSEEPAPEDVASESRVSDAAQAAKLAELESLLAEDEDMSRRWWRGWTLVQTGLILTQLGVGYFLMDDPDDAGLRASAYLNAGASGVGLLSLLVLRPPALKARKRVLSLPAGTPKERAAKLRAAEELVEESGKGQKFGTGWAPYTGGAIVGAAVALPLWLKFERPLEATMSFVGAIGFTVVQTLTTPTRARDYRERNPVQLSWGVSLGGVSLSGKF